MGNHMVASVGTDGMVNGGRHELNLSEASTIPFKHVNNANFTVGTGHNTGLQVKGCQEVSSASLAIEGGVLSTARNSGMVVQNTWDVKDTTVVKVNGMEVNAKTAASLGFLTRNSDGSYSEANSSPKLTGADESPSDDTHQVEPTSTELSTPELEGALEVYAQALGSYESLERHALSAIAGLVKGDAEYAAGNLAKSTGMEVEGTTEFISAAVEHFTAQSENYITRKHGVSGADAIEWASHALDPSERASIAHHVYMGKSSALDGLAVKYMKALSIQRSRNRGAA